jgi:hypothetical protein
MPAGANHAHGKNEKTGNGNDAGDGGDAVDEGSKADTLDLAAEMPLPADDLAGRRRRSAAGQVGGHVRGNDERIVERGMDRGKLSGNCSRQP